MKLLVLPGDGIGPEITDATLEVLEAASKKFSLGLKFDTQPVGLAALKSHGTTMPDGLLGRASRGGRDHPRAARPDELSGEREGRHQRVGGVPGQARPLRQHPPGAQPQGAGRRKEPMDLVIVRECTEGFYADRNMYQGSGEFMPTPDVAMSMRKITAQACERIARRAFELAMKRRKHVTAVHKANVFRVTDGLFLDKVREVACGVSRREAGGDHRRRDGGAPGARARALRRGARHQYVRRHPVRPRLRALGQPRPRRLGAGGRYAVLRAGAARLGAGHRRARTRRIRLR